MNRSIVTARFQPGQIVHHQAHGFRAVIVDVDARYNGSRDWYESHMQHRPGREQPWYHLLVDGADFAAYAAEDDLRAGAGEAPVDHPWLENFFVEFYPAQGQYVDRYPRM